MEFRDLKKQYLFLQEDIDRKIQSVCASAHYISGSEVSELEKQLADYAGVKYCVTCANGTDAITLALKAWKVGKGDAVFVPDFTFFASGECPANEDATCIFVDVDKRTFNIDPIKLEQAIINVLKEGKYLPKVVIAVDLFGQPAQYDEIRRICNQYGLFLLEDGAQGFGGKIGERMACSFGDISTTSFFPAKPLGCYGDGGAIFTDNEEWAVLIRSLAIHGKNGTDKYDNIRLGINSRLDTIQAAILQVKLEAFKNYEVADVNRVAEWYRECLKETDYVLPFVLEGYSSSWAQYTIQLPADIQRDCLQAELRKIQIPTMVYYAKPMHLQGAFANTDSAIASCEVSKQLCEKVLSLPIHPYMSYSDVLYVADNLKKIICNLRRKVD